MKVQKIRGGEWQKTDLVVKKYPAARVERTLQALVAAKLVVIGGGESDLHEGAMIGERINDGGA